MSIKKNILTFLLCSLWFSIHTTSHPFTVVLDPGSGYESAVLQMGMECLEAMRQALEDTFPQARIVLARTAQDRADHTQIASFSNRLQADLHVSFNFVALKDSPSSIHVYTYADALHQTIFSQPSQDLSFTPVSTAYLGNQKKSHEYASFFVTAVKTIGTAPVHPPASLPLKALQGILAPAFLVELSLTSSRDRKMSFTALCEGFTKLISKFITQQIK